MVTETRLIEWNRIKAAIAQQNDITELGKMNYSLEAIQKWAKQSKQSLETQNEIAEYRLRLNRKQGEWIERTIPEKGYSNLPTQNVRQEIPTLTEVGIDKHDSPKFRTLANIPADKFENYIREAKDSGEEITTNDACKLANKPHVANNSGNNEWYTPGIFIEAARSVMGSIDTDPASSEIANQIVKAKSYFTLDNDGKIQTWQGNVWLNPPYAQPLVTEFCDLLVNKYKSKEIQQACVLVNNATETSFFQNMLAVCQAACFIKGRVKFIDEAGKESGAPLQGQAVLYFGPNKNRFTEYFNQLGIVLHAE